MPSLLDDPEAYAFAAQVAEDRRRKLTNQQALNAILQGVGDLPYTLLGAPVEISTGLLRAGGMAQGEQVGGIDYIKRKATELGIRPPDSNDPTMRDMRMGAEIVSGAIDPTRVARAGGAVAGAVAREAKPIVGNALESYMARSGLAPRAVPEGGLLGSSPAAPVSLAGFYSAAEQAALNLQRNKGTGQAFINDLMKAPDVKKEELQYTGLLDAFADKPQATKQELIDYLRVNRPDVKSRTLRDIEDVTYDQAESEYIRQTGFSPPEDMGIGEIWDSLPKEASAQYKSDSLQGGKNYREILLQLPQKDEYYSSHWDEPNVFAHVRLNDRLDSEGKKMTLIEEVQSDWHQAGREQGYRRPNKERIPTSFEQDRTGWSVFDQDGNEITYITNDINPGGTKEGAINIAQQRLDSDKFIVRSKNVPEAPMKETWYQTALRKAVKDAIDQGSDRVGIVTGSRNAERFGKGKRIDNIGITNFDGGFKEIEMQTPDGGSFYAVVDKDGVISEANSNLVHEFNGKKLEDMIGKSAAQKVLSSQENQFIPVSDVVVGGKGMKKYYDDVYPKYLDKFAKKYGSSIKEGSLGTDKPQSFATMLDKSEFKSEWALADKFRREEIIDILEARTKKEPIRYIEITPEMRKALGGSEKGVPLFGAGGLGLLAADEETKQKMQSLLGY